MNRLLLIVLFSSIATLSIAQVSGRENSQQRPKIELKGVWEFALDPSGVGIKEKWFQKGFSDLVNLPGTTDINKKGYYNKDTTTLHLNRIYKFEGAAWYRKKIWVPKDFKNKHVQLFLERTKPSTLWIDGKHIGKSNLLQSAHIYDVTSYLSPGEHFITIRIDNTLKLTPYGNVHIYSDDTQTNWNGILGEMYLEATPKTYINDMQIFPDIDKRKIGIKLGISNKLGLKDLSIDLLLEKSDSGSNKALKVHRFKRAADSVITLEYEVGQDMELWDEFRQPLYTLTALISRGKTKDSKSATFGMRKFTTDGTQFRINGRTTFLRGKHDAAVFPITGYAPMDVYAWIKVFRIAKDYGINCYRFHTWCPPEAAFTAADRVGIYLQAELPFWGGLEADTTANMLQQEGFAMLKSYANHPSFVMFSHGNEIWSGLDRIEKNIVALKNYDSRPLYTMGSNVSIGYASPQKSTDFFVGSRTPSNGDTILTHTRLTHAFVDSKDGGMLNTLKPSTEIKFTYPVSQLKIPIVSHEIGQYQIYPDYKEIEKYTGALQARNLEVFRERLKAAGLMDQNLAFQKASGAWSALCYKAEMEAALRTPGFGGFHLLDLQDFPGQGTALVGVLDAFMDSKNVISKEEWRESCNDVVLLMEFPKYCWTNKEEFAGKVAIANYSNRNIDEDVLWEIINERDEVLGRGKLVTGNNLGGVKEIGVVSFALSEIKEAQKLTIKVFTKNSSYRNNYPVWVYPVPQTITPPKDILISSKLDAAVAKKLRAGGKVLLFPQGELNVKSSKGLFPPDFWNWGMFKGISEGNKKPVSPGTLGLLMDPEHLLFNSFPTDFHTNWQWFSIIKKSAALNLNETDQRYKPIVQVIDNLERNIKLGLVFEFKVGEGKLLVCMAPLNQMQQIAEANQLFRSVLNYMNTKNFNPINKITDKHLSRLFTK